LSALGEARLLRDIVFICNNLTSRTQGFLMDGSIDMVLHAGATPDYLRPSIAAEQGTMTS